MMITMGVFDRAGFAVDMLQSLGKKPPLRSPSSDFWADPYISEHVLDIHLSQEEDAASRKIDRIAAEAAWIGARLNNSCESVSVKQEFPLLLDLGCGPGLYAEEFLKQNYNVYGLDFSPSSIQYAQERLKVYAKPSAQFYVGDFTRAAYPSGCDAAVMIYGIFGNLYDTDRDRVLKKLWKALRPGGRFVFDVFTEGYAQREALREGWYVSKKDGFWRADEHLVLEKSWFYTRQRTVFNAYYILNKKAELTTKLVRHRWYDHNEVCSVLTRNGFRVLETAADLCGGQYSNQGDWFAIVAERMA